MEVHVFQKTVRSFVNQIHGDCLGWAGVEARPVLRHLVHRQRLGFTRLIPPQLTHVLDLLQLGGFLCLVKLHCIDVCLLNKLCRQALREHPSPQLPAQHAVCHGAVYGHQAVLENLQSRQQLIILLHDFPVFWLNEIGIFVLHPGHVERKTSEVMPVYRGELELERLRAEGGNESGLRAPVSRGHGRPPLAPLYSFLCPASIATGHSSRTQPV
mmetsp:Transcript_5969/g.9704  ORF Transcript_5969/g.9704 Transcript_5969/m.9704 type:complete len:213 (-) Transcript_5969:310-948(-)